MRLSIARLCSPTCMVRTATTTSRTMPANHAHELAAKLKDKFPESDYTWRAATLVFKLDQGVPVYGIDLQ